MNGRSNDGNRTNSPRSEQQRRKGAPRGPVRFHLSINVTDLAASVRFYRTLFDIEPAKCYDDYAKFELAEPPLVLSLEPQAHAGGGALNHLGFRLREAKELVEIQRRLEAAGNSTLREDGVECCYARQTKFFHVIGSKPVGDVRSGRGCGAPRRLTAGNHGKPAGARNIGRRANRSGMGASSRRAVPGIDPTGRFIGGSHPAPRYV